MGRGFLYALEPVLLTRRWMLQECLAELSRAQAEQLSAERRQASLQAALAAACADFATLRHGMAAACFLRSLSYLAQCQAEADLAQASVAACSSAREAAAAAVRTAQARVDAVDQHRNLAWSAYRQQLQNQEFKGADEHWNLGSASKDGHAH